MSDFYLTQRLERRTSEYKIGFDRMFACEYMGSAEFESGAIPASLRRLRAAKSVVLREGLVTRKSVTTPVFVVGSDEIVATIPDRLTAWLADEYPRGKEVTYFEHRIEGTASQYVRTNAWWALNEDVMWSLDRAIADDLLAAVTS